jgi:hypothetical protein
MAIQHKPLDGHIVDLHLDRQYVHGDHVGLKSLRIAARAFLRKSAVLDIALSAFTARKQTSPSYPRLERESLTRLKDADTNLGSPGNP